MFADPTTEWFKWFAWRPVHTWDRGWRWLRSVWKRRCQPHSYLPGPQSWFYQFLVTNPKEELDGK